MKSYPPNPEPNQIPEPEFRLGDMILWHLNFYRRSILGVILVAGVAYLLVTLNKPSSSVDEFEEYSVAKSDISSPPASAGTVSQASNDLAVAERSTVAEPVAVASAAQRVDQLLNTADQWRTLGNSQAVVFLKKRIETIKELLQATDLTPRQRDYCDRDWIDAVGTLIGISNKTDAGIEGVDELVAEVDRAYGESEAPETAAAANVVYVRHTISRFIASQSDEDFKAFKNALLDRQAVILESARCHIYLSRALDEAVAIVGDDARLREIVIEHLMTVANLKNNVATDLAVTLFFPQIDIDALPGLVMAQDPTADSDVELMLKELKEHPNMPLPIYSAVASSIARYRDVGKDGKADRYLEQLKEIAPTIPNELVRKEILGGVKSLEKKPSDKKPASGE